MTPAQIPAKGNTPDQASFAAHNNPGMGDPIRPGLCRRPIVQIGGYVRPSTTCRSHAK